MAVAGVASYYCHYLTTPRRYPPNMFAMLNADAAAYSVLNFGVNGATMMRTGDNPYWGNQEYADALASSPDIVVIMLGTNDAKTYQWNQTQYTADYTDMVKAFAELTPSPDIYLAVPPPLYAEGTYNMSQKVINIVLPRLIPSIAAENGIPAANVIDVFSALGGAGLSRYEYFCDHQSCDNCHPNDAGYSALAATVYRATVGFMAPTPTAAGGPVPWVGP